MCPLFLDGPAGSLFAVLYLPLSDAPTRRWVLLAPAFAEEMNRCRAMCAVQARAFAREGHTVLVPDLGGSGDSRGDFSEATWSAWRGEMAFLVRWAQDRGAEEVVLWGVRLGALLALETAASQPGMVRELLLWQPVYQGRQAVTQFLRLRMAASLGQERRETVAELRQRAADGEVLEVAGYALNPVLIAELDEADSEKIQWPEPLSIHLLEVVGDGDKPLSPVAQRQMEAWRTRGHRVTGKVVPGEPFWNTQELAWAPALIEASSALTGRPPVPPNGEALRPESISGPLSERACRFDCSGETLPGIVHPGHRGARRGVLVVVGGPQYRVGSHRQFVLLARGLAAGGIPVFRFDYRGMGDASGDYAGFTHIDQDIRCAIDAFQYQCPDLGEVVIWGLCDAATAGALYSATDERVSGLVLLNPWVRSESGEARAYLRHWYLRRLASADFWRKVLRGEWNAKASAFSLGRKLRVVANGGRERQEENAGATLASRLEEGLRRFRGSVLLVLSGNDLTAAEFEDSIGNTPGFTSLLQQERFTISRIAHADHTFSRAQWRDEVSRETLDWLARL